MLHARAILTATLLLALTACGAREAGTRPAPRASPRLISSEEVASVQVPTAYDLVQRLRPLWLARSSPFRIRSEGDIAVYVNDRYFGGPFSLRHIEAGTVREIRLLTANLAAFSFGTNHSTNAIQIITNETPLNRPTF